MPLALIPLLLLAVPLLEIAAFVLVGQWLGLWPTLGLVVLSAVVGALLLRRQGLAVLKRIQVETAAGRVPGGELLDAMLIVAAGVLLLTPGFVTDAVGYLLFVPAVRAAVRRGLARRATGPGPGGGGRPEADGTAARRGADVVELTRDDYARRPDPASPWHTAHDGNRTLH